MSFSRAERRRELAQRAKRVDPSCPPELIREIDATMAAAIVGKQIRIGETIGDVTKRLCPEIFAAAERQGFVLSFRLPQNTHEALTRGIIAYSLKRRALH